MTRQFEQYSAYAPVPTTVTASTWGGWQAISLKCLGCKHHFLYGTASMCSCASRTLVRTEHGDECDSYCPREGAEMNGNRTTDALVDYAWRVLPYREPGVLYIRGVSVPGLDYADYKAIEVDGHRFERVRECELEHHDTGWVSCRECNTSWKNDRPHVYRRCPYCGARVKEVDAYD